jgi:pseudaminic acid cytidylyltransferase
MKIAVIPARGGSKRIPDKNIRDFCGKPMLHYPIEAARRSGGFDRIIVSTDSERIADVARKAGAEVPFMRPAHLADDMTPTVPVIQHAIEWMQRTQAEPTHVCCIYATAPFLSPDDLRAGFEAMVSAGAAYAIGVTKYSFPIQRALRVTPKGRIAMFQPEHFSTRSQDLEPAFHDAGQFYWGTARAWMDGVSDYSGESVPVFIPSHRVQDIDDNDDWLRAELMYRALHAGSAST